MIHVVVARAHRRAAFEAREIRHAAHRIDRAGTGSRLAPRPRMAVRRAAQRDDARIHASETLVVEAQAAHRPRPEVVGHDVAVFDELQEHFLARGMRHLETQALLVARPEIGEVRAFVPPLRAGLAVRERPRLAILEMPDALDADDLCAEIREERGAPRQCVHLLQCQNTDSFKHRCGHGSSLRARCHRVPRLRA